MSIIISPRTREIGTAKDTYFGFITVDDRPDVWESLIPAPVGPAPVYCIASLCPDGSARDAQCRCPPSVDGGGGIIFPGDPAIQPIPSMPPVNEGPVQEQPPWWQLPGLFPVSTPQAHPIGAAGTTVVQGGRQANPLATLLLLAGIAAVGYYLYKRYRS